RISRDDIFDEVVTQLPLVKNPRRNKVFIRQNQIQYEAPIVCVKQPVVEFRKVSKIRIAVGVEWSIAANPSAEQHSAKMRKAIGLSRIGKRLKGILIQT